LHDGQRLSLGEVTLEILATPGHTPESICVVVWEHPDDPAPHGVLTGDTLFVGDVGRPDLLASAGADLSAEALARRLYRSLRDKLLVLPDATKVYPAHGAGSACGKALSTETTSTIGEQRRANYALQDMGEDAFVAAVAEGQPARPATSPSTPAPTGSRTRCSTSTRPHGSASTVSWPGGKLALLCSTPGSRPTSRSPTWPEQ
jgi:glyoxylase-like metal-dependent hydrolase (beta-lactamase superfamily II)